jgi:hypothetical protein
MGRKSIVKPAPDAQPIDFQRLIRRKLGVTAKEIALADGVSEEVVSSSINAAQLYLETHSLEYCNASVAGIVTDVSKEVRLALKRGLTATTRKKNKWGRTVLLHDHKTQLNAVGQVTGLVEAIQPKGKGIVVNTSAAANSTSQAAGFSEENYQPGFEELIDSIRAKVERQNLVPREVSTTVDDVILDAEELVEESTGEPDSRNEDDEPDGSAEASP